MQPSVSDGPSSVSCLASFVPNGKLTEPADTFGHPYWDWVRENAPQKARFSASKASPALRFPEP